MIFLAICMIITLVILYVVVQELKDQKKEIKELKKEMSEFHYLIMQYGSSISGLRDGMNTLTQEFQDILKKNASIKTDIIRANNLITRTKIEVRKLADKSVFDRKEPQDEQNDRD